MKTTSAIGDRGEALVKQILERLGFKVEHLAWDDERAIRIVKP